ncbi:hypothetical protein V6Z11_A05G031400 [Gossypium hirsutum]
MEGLLQAGSSYFYYKMKHVGLDMHFIQEKVARGELQINHVSGQHQVASLFIKPSFQDQFTSVKSKHGVCTFLNDLVACLSTELKKGT